MKSLEQLILESTKNLKIDRKFNESLFKDIFQKALKEYQQGQILGKNWKNRKLEPKFVVFNDKAKKGFLNQYEIFEEAEEAIKKFNEYLKTKVQYLQLRWIAIEPVTAVKKRHGYLCPEEENSEWHMTDLGDILVLYSGTNKKKELQYNTKQEYWENNNDKI